MLTFLYGPRATFGMCYIECNVRIELQNRRRTSLMLTFFHGPRATFGMCYALERVRVLLCLNTLVKIG